MVLQARDAARWITVTGRRAGARAPPPRRRAPASSGSRFQATRTPPGASSGRASSTSSASDATARAVTRARRRGRAGRGRAPPRAAPPRRRAARGRSPRSRSGGSGPSCRPSRRAAPGRDPSAAASGMPGKAAARPEVEQPRDPARPQERRRGEESSTWRRATSAGLADRGQVDRRRSRRAGGGRARRGSRARGGRGPARAPGGRPRGVGVRGGERLEVLNTRRERISRAVQGTLLWSCAGSPGSRSRRDRSPRPASVGLAAPRRFRPGSPRCPSGMKLPDARMRRVRSADVRRTPVRRQGELSTNCGRSPPNCG